jgi:hypothetical protein
MAGSMIDRSSPPTVVERCPPPPRFDHLLEIAYAARPDMVIRSISLNGEAPVLHVIMGEAPEPGSGASAYLRIDTRTANILPAPPRTLGRRDTVARPARTEGVKALQLNAVRRSPAIPSLSPD